MSAMGILASLVDKMSSHDKDFRYMATSDLLNELQKEEFQVDPDWERRLCAVVLRQLEDQSSDIQTLAVKCLAPLVKHVNGVLVDDIANNLCSHILKEKSSIRDIAAIGLKNVIASAELDSARSAATRFVPRLLTGVTQNELEIKLECLDVLNDAFERLGDAVSSLHEHAQSALLREITANRTMVRKRAVAALGALSLHSSDGIFSSLIRYLVEQLSRSQGNDKRSFALCLGSITRVVGSRLGPHIGSVFPVLSEICSHSDDDDDLREVCLQSFEASFRRCPREASAYAETAVSMCLDLIRYDPNYAYGSDGEDDDAEDMSDDGEGDLDSDFDDDEYSADDDLSWKVRRAAANCLSAIVESQTLPLLHIYNHVLGKVAHRLREREESVRLDVFKLFSEIIRSAEGRFHGSSGSLSCLREQVTPLVERIIKDASSHVQDKKKKNKAPAVLLLRDVARVFPLSLEAHTGLMIPCIKNTLADKSASATLKAEALMLLKELCEAHDWTVMQPYMPNVFDQVILCSSEKYYKVAAESLRTLCAIVPILRPKAGQTQETFDHRLYVPRCFNASLSKLSSKDVDSEVKEAAIRCIGLVVARFADDMGADAEKGISTLIALLDSEISRRAAAIALCDIASSVLPVPLSKFTAHVVQTLSAFLRQSDRRLRTSALETLCAWMRREGPEMSDALAATALQEAAALICGSDTRTAALAIRLGMVSASVSPARAAAAWATLAPAVLQLVEQSTGGTDSALVALVMSVERHAPSVGAGAAVAEHGVAANPVTASMCARATAEIAGDVKGHLERAMASGAYAVAGELALGLASGTRLSHVPNSAASPETSNLVVNEVAPGTRDLSAAHTALTALLEASRAAADRVIAEAAAAAAGRAAGGAFGELVPQVLGAGDARVVLAAVRSAAKAAHELHDIYTVEESAVVSTLRAVLSAAHAATGLASECAGLLGALAPGAVARELGSRLGDADDAVRTACCAGARHMVVGGHAAALEIPQLLRCIRDDALTVRKEAAILLHTILLRAPAQLGNEAGSFLQPVFELLAPRADLIREYDLGPFKHRVDEGLELRKVALQCVDVGVSAFGASLPMDDLLQQLLYSLEDDTDVRMVAHKLLAKVASLAPSAVVARTPEIVPRLRKSIESKAKRDAVKQEVERVDALIRSAMSAVRALQQHSTIAHDAAVVDLVTNVCETGAMIEQWNATSSESAAPVSEKGADGMDLS